MAAALVLIYPLAEEPHLLLTVRTDQLAQHAGQVSFPGGGLEPNETIDKAALRETEEEVGLDPKQVHLIGALSPLYIPVSDFALYPIVGVTHYPHAWQSAAAEVRRVLEAPVTELLTTAGPHRGYLCDKNHPCRVPYFEVGGERVWGATAMILAELMTAIGASVKDPWDNLDTEESETS
jgi:8-oxo-dGTP pyrophosphatase MutT (NUDIX family)